MLKGDKINLRVLQLKDLEMFRYWQIGEHKWKQFNGPYYKQATEHEVDALIEKIKKRIEQKTQPAKNQKLFIADSTTDELIGSVSWYWQSEETNWKSIGVIIYNDNYWSKGIGFSALSLWIDHLFKLDEKLVRLDLRTWSGNIGMMKCAEKLGFTQEACFRKARIVNGKYYDSVGYGILREEWFDKLK